MRVTIRVDLRVQAGHGRKRYRGAEGQWRLWLGVSQRDGRGRAECAIWLEMELSDQVFEDDKIQDISDRAECRSHWS